MNALGLTLAGLLGIHLALPAEGQDDDKLRRDPTYSIHNYKHPNKAATALRWAIEEGKAKELNRIPVNANYKRPRDSSGTGSAVILPVETVPPQNYKMPRNYKMPMPIRRRKD